QRPLDLDGGAVVVAVEAFALVAFVADEVPGAEDQVVLGDADVEAFGHGLLGEIRQRGADHGTCGGKVMIPSRSATNKQAATRSAVVPGLRRWPSARSQASKSA